MPCVNATKSSRLSQTSLPGAFVSLVAVWVFLGLSASVSAQQASESQDEPEEQTSGGDQAQESDETQNVSQAPAPSSNRGVIELESQVTGNQEQPQVFYVVPWQSPESPQLPYDPLSSQLEQVFGHLEREELRRELKQREQFQPEADSEPRENQ